MNKLTEPRKKFGGRKAGTPNKITSEIRKLAKATLEEDLIWYIENRDNFKPETRLVAMFKLCSYVLPKVISEYFFCNLDD